MPVKAGDPTQIELGVTAIDADPDDVQEPAIAFVGDGDSESEWSDSAVVNQSQQGQASTAAAASDDPKAGSDPMPTESQATATVEIGEESIVHSRQCARLCSAKYPYVCPNCNLAIASYTLSLYPSSPSVHILTSLPSTLFHTLPYPYTNIILVSVPLMFHPRPTYLTPTTFLPKPSDDPATPRNTPLKMSQVIHVSPPLSNRYLFELLY